MVSEQPVTVVREPPAVWEPTIPDSFDGELRIPLPDEFEVTEAWWDEMLYAQKGRFPEITRDRLLTLHEGNMETSRVSVWMSFQIGTWMQCGGGCGLTSSASFTLPSGARRSSCGSWISPQRMPDMPRQWRDPLGVIPDLIFEVSPLSLPLSIVHEKMVEWIEGGVRLGWLLDPYGRKVWIYRANGEVEELDDPGNSRVTTFVAGLLLICLRSGNDGSDCCTISMMTTRTTADVTMLGRMVMPEVLPR